MAYSKSKHVEAAQKLLNQGKVPQAIAEYQQILKYEPRDQVTLMTIGELYIRQGETFQAIDYFERLAQIFVGDGFLTKAIAVYKRIAKLAPEEIRPLERLADLYVQQGVMSEARPLFLQLAELHLKSNRQPEAVALLKKLLLAEPDNLRIQIRLADLYQAMGQTSEAVESYVSAAQRSLARGDQGEAEKLADKALKLDPANLAAVTVKARAYSSQGNATQAADLLAKTPHLEKGGEQTELLLDLYAKNGKWEEAEALARRVIDSDAKNFGPAQKVAEALLESGQTDKAMALISHVRIPLIDSGEHEVIGRLLNDLAARAPGRLEPLEWLVDTYGRTSDSFRLPDALAHLVDGLVSAGKLERAKEVCERLIDRQPESESAKRKLNEILRKLGQPASAEPMGIPDEPLQAELPKAEALRVRPSVSEPLTEAKPEAVVPPAEPVLDDETQKFIAQSLTDVDLFASYGLTQKAIGLLEAILRRAPRHTPTLEKLLDFVLGAGDDRRTAELAAELERIHGERDDARGAERFGELRRRYQRAAGLSDADLAPKQASAAPAAAAQGVVAHAELLRPPEPPPAAAPTAEEVHEVDLSSEWESVVEDTRPKEHAPVPAAAHSGEVTEFEIPVESPSDHERAPAEPSLPSFEDVASPAPPPAPEPPPQIHEEPIALEPAEPKPAAKKAPPPPPPAPKKEEPEFDLAQEYELVLEQEPLVPAHEQRPPESSTRPPAAPVAHNAAPGNTFASDQFLSDLANEIDQLGMDKLSPSFSEPAAEHPKAAKPRHEEKPAEPAGHEPLREVFDEFRAELGEMGAEDEDLETHYNLGIAFREMGLLEEAISEFQKVAKANDHGKAFRYAMQCCTLLGLAFMEKGQPGIAAIWYERALHTPGVDQESALALRYDLGVAQESAGDPAAALKSFSQVYAVNIDYRDVAERIAVLQKPIR